MIRDGGRREEAGELELPVAVRRAHHGNLDALIAQSSDTSGPFSFDRGPLFELKTELAIEINRPSGSSTTIPMLSIRLSAMYPIYKVSSIIARFAGRVNLLQIERKLATSEKHLSGDRAAHATYSSQLETGAASGKQFTRRQALVDGQFNPKIWLSHGTC